MKTVFTKVIFEKEGFCIVADAENRVFQGSFVHNIEDILDIPIEVKADEVMHPKFGKQYKIKDYTILEEPLSFFLRKVVKSGLPKKTITELTKKYSLEEFKKILEKDSGKLLEIKNLGKVRLDKIKKSFLSQKDLIELTEILSKANITSEFLRKIYDFIKANRNKQNKITAKDISENPYILTKIDGIGFKKADSIAIKLGIDELDKKRITAYINYAINQITLNRGDTLHLKNDILDLMIKDLSLKDKVSQATSMFSRCLQRLEDEEEIIEYAVNQKRFIIKSNYYHMEKYILNLIEEYPKMKYWSNYISKEKIKRFIDENAKYDLSALQRKAITDFSTSEYPFFILAGYAGAGKTTTAELIIKIYAELYGKENIIACALSGNASNRIKTVTGFEAKTIHSLLGYQGNGFYYNEINPLNYKLIVLDEASMVDIYMFYHLLKAIDFSKTKLFIIGDNAQLPPVGAGEVFSNMLEIDTIQKIVLDEVFRQDKDKKINQFAKEIRQGIVPKGYKDKMYEDFIFKKIEINNYYAVSKNLKDKEKKVLRDEVNTKIRDYVNTLSRAVNEKVLNQNKTEIINAFNSQNYKEFKESALNYINAYQIISPQKKGILGTIELNQQTKQIINPSDKDTNPYHLDRLDKVIHLKNINKQVFSFEEYIELRNDIALYLRSSNNSIENKIYYLKNKLNIQTEEQKEHSTRVFNGQVGIIIDTINIRHNEELYSFIVVYYPNEDYFTFYGDFEMKEKIIDLAYCFTIHKSQGSEYDYVVLPISLSNAFMFNNKLLYTAVTRAKEKLILVGETYAFQMGVKKKDEIKRKTLMLFHKNQKK